MPFGQLLKAGLKKVLPKKPMATRVNKITKTKKGTKKPQAVKVTSIKTDLDESDIRKYIEKEENYNEVQEALGLSEFAPMDATELSELALEKSEKFISSNFPGIKASKTKNIPHFLKPQASGIAGTSVLLNSGLNKKDK